MAEQRVIVENPVSVTNTTGSTFVAIPMVGVDSVSNTGAVANVLAGQAIASVTIPSTGYWRLNVHRAADGAGTPVLYNNGQLKVGANTYTMLSLPELGIVYEYDFYFNITSGTVVSINAVTNGSANITVAATIIATRIS